MSNLPEGPEETVREVLRRQEESATYKAAADLLRALVLLYGSAWESDLLDTLSGLWSVRGLELDQMGAIQGELGRAAEMLSQAGVIVVERRLRADLNRATPLEEAFYSARDLSLLLRLFSSDRDIDRYRFMLSGSFPTPRG